MAMVDTGSPGEVLDAGSQRSRGLVIALMLLAALGSLAIIPFSRTILRQALPPEFPPQWLPFVLALTFIVELVLSAVAIPVGLWAGDRVGLGAPLLRAWLEGDRDAGRQLRSSIGRAFVLGLGLGVLVMVAVLIVDPLIPSPTRPLAHPPAWEALLASLGAGIREELWLRLGVMTPLVWLGCKVTRRTGPSPAVIWPANAFAAALFAAIHLPQASVLFGLSAPILAFVLVGNGLPGLAFGWLYWRRGLMAAMAAHGAVDVVLKVVLPLVPFR
jgi:membrane protease YdiL (CAAX protease family)